LVADADRHRVNRRPDTAHQRGDTTTVNMAIEAWRDNGWDDLSPTTVRRYEGLWATHVRDSIGRRSIASLRPYDVERYFRSLKAKGMAHASVRQVRAMLHRACRLATRWSGGTLTNPIADTELPAWSLTEKTVIRAPTISEVRTLLAVAVATDLRCGAFLQVIAATGMRRGEACALRWSDIDAVEATVQIDESVISARGGARVKPPKTSASIRRVALDADSLTLLQLLRQQQARLAAVAARNWDDNAFVFAFVPGGREPPHPDAMSHAFTRIRNDAGVKADIHLHSLRAFMPPPPMP
jgi:integrase